MLAISQLQTKSVRFPAVSTGPAEYTEVDGVWMMIDLVDSTSWYVSLDKMTAFSLLRVCLERMGGIVRQNNGKIVKLTGDGLHARFQRPIDALLCAVAYQNSMTPLNDRSLPCYPRARIGLTIGPCVQCKICECVDYYGHAVLLAMRLAQQGGCDQIVMSDELVSEPEIKKALKTVHVEAEMCTLKGFPQPLRVHRVDPGNLHQLEA